MISPQERLADAVRYGQETMNSTVRTWSDSMQKLVSNIDLNSTIPTLDELVDRSYEFGVHLLAMQRDFTKNLLAYAEPLTETLSNAPKQAERFVMKTERTAAKKAEETAAKAEDIAAEAERTANKAQHSASARSGRAPRAKK
jgi:ABC-type transporter Mla subunit MlaD